MRTFLDKVREEKLELVNRRQAAVGEAELWERLKTAPPAKPFAHLLNRSLTGRFAVIAEIKLRAPGRGTVEGEAGLIARDYAEGGAAAISVLTDEGHFGGALGDLSKVRRVSELPLLQKEFIVAPYQMLEGRLLGADAALVLSYYFTEEQLKAVLKEAAEMGIEPVVECSVDEEISRVVAANPRVILLNNRPISTLPESPGETYKMGSVQRAQSFWERHAELREWKQQPDRVLISASCVSRPEDVSFIARLPFDAALVGNAACQALDRSAFLRSLVAAAMPPEKEPEPDPLTALLDD